MSTKTSLLTKQRLLDAHAKDTDLVLKERMPSGLPGEGADKAEGSDKTTIAGDCESIAMDTIVFLFERQNFSHHRSKVTLNRLPNPTVKIFSTYTLVLADLGFSPFPFYAMLYVHCTTFLTFTIYPS